MLMQLKDDVVPNIECLTDQHFQLYQTWRIIHLLLVYTRKFQRLMLIFFLQFDNIDYKLQARAKECFKIREK